MGRYHARILNKLAAPATALAVAAFAASCQTEPAKPAPVAAASPQPAPAPSPAAPPAPSPSPAATQTVSAGEAVYQKACASCHDRGEAMRAPSKEQLLEMSAQFISYTINTGKMEAQARSLTGPERTVLVDYLSAKATAAAKLGDWTTTNMCAADQRAVDVSAQVISAGFGYDLNNTRNLTAKQAGLTTKQLSNMELAWAIGFPGVAEMRSQGAVVGTTLFLPVAGTGQTYAINLATPKPCVKWVYTRPGGGFLRSSGAYGVAADGTPLIVFTSLDPVVYALDARTGKELWMKNIGAYSYSMASSTPVVLKDRIIVPMSQYEIVTAGDDNTLCCTNHGYVVSLDPKTGAQQWRYDTMEDAKEVRKRPDGKPYYAPSGAPIWNSAVVDEKRGLVYFATGEANSEPAHKNTNAIIAIGLKDGKEKWSFQATPHDIYIYGCGVKPPPGRQNCPNETVYRDVDFGASVILGTLKNGKQLLFAGQKSGAVWALDPDTGKVAWMTPIGTGTPLGGVHWGMAYKDDVLFVPIANIGRALPGEPPIDPKLKAGLYALDAATGKIKWMYSPDPLPAVPGVTGMGGRPGRNTFFSTASTVIDGTVVSAALDGTIFVNDAKDGKLLWSYNTARTFEAANGVKTNGGSIDANAITAGNGLLLVTSGYGQFGQITGNVLLAFKPKS